MFQKGFQRLKFNNKGNKEKNKSVGLHRTELKSFCIDKDISILTEGHPTVWDKIFIKYALITRIRKERSKLNTERKKSKSH